jgi:hypothetical protein
LRWQSIGTVGRMLIGNQSTQMWRAGLSPFKGKEIMDVLIVVIVLLLLFGGGGGLYWGFGMGWGIGPIGLILVAVVVSYMLFGYRGRRGS